ncbi:hypothetical protein [Burkholderia sp. Bp9143]|uniref:hypothetical protein n=1 Tax=Burkholderia sp. Bp9143 TaxID=2184574 RepID=UPI0021AB487A|nr:hypothetical protein [Burkholderia sp. Bp9143]
MTALHMPVPTTLFATLETAVASVSTMMGALNKLGPDATVAELLGATTKLEVATVVGAILGSAYLGAVIGSLMVATDAASACGIGKHGSNLSLAVAQWGARYRLAIHPLIMAQILRHPEFSRPARIAISG